MKNIITSISLAVSRVLVWPSSSGDGYKNKENQVFIKTYSIKGKQKILRVSRQ